MPALDSAQLALLRSAPQTSHWYCVPVPPVIVFQARINGSPANGAVVIPYDSVTVGAFADVLQGMTLLVGSAAGLSDYATIRIRLDADASNLYVAWNSDVAWADNLYLTVLQQFLPWGVRQRIVPPTVYKDYNIAYTDLTVEWPPVALMGDNVCQLFTGNPTAVYFDGSFSYPVAPAVTITGYLWDFGDGNTSAFATPGYHNYIATGTYYASLTVTDSNGKTHTTRRIIALPTLASIYTVNFEGTSLESQIDNGWSAKVRVFDPNASTAHFPERAPCFLIASDTFAGTSGSVGFPIGREQIVFFGYIADDSVAIQPEYNEVTFDLESIAGVMGRIDMTPVFLSDSADPAGEPDAWAWGSNLNVLRGLVYLLKFHSTIMDIADVTLYNDTTLTKAVDYPQDNLWNMLVQFAKGKRLMHAGVTRTGRVVVGVDPNLIPVAARGAITTVCQLAYGDTREQVTAPQTNYPRTAFECISGLIYDGVPANEPNPVFGMSPGRPPKDYGEEKEIQFLKFIDQSECNQLAGLLVGTDNMPYDPITIPLRGNWLGCFEPALQEYVTTPSGGWTTKRGVILDGVPLIVRKVSAAFDWTAGVVNCTLTCDYTSVAEISTNGDCWPPDAPLPPTTIPPITIIVPPPTPTTTIAAPTLTGRACVVEPTTNTLAWTSVFNVDGYKVYRNAVLIATITNAYTRNYTDSGLSVDTAYTYTVRGYKASVNGTLSNSVVLTTCLTPVAFHNKAVLCTPNHVLEWSAFGGYGYTSDVPIDIKGNIIGTITDFQVQNGIYVAIANNQVWRYVGGSTWIGSEVAEDVAKTSGAWSTQFFPTEDGSGTHGLAWWGCRGTCSTGAFPCDTPHFFDDGSCIHFGYAATSGLSRLVGNHTFLNNSLNTVESDCSVKENGAYDVPMNAGAITTTNPCCIIPPYGVPADAWDTSTPSVYSVGFGIFSHSIIFPQHFSPYYEEPFHVFLNDLDTFTFANLVFLDGVDVTATWANAPLWVTDGTDIYAWAFDSEVWQNGSLYLDEATLELISGLSDINIRLTGGVFGLNVCPASSVRRVIVYLRFFSEFVSYVFQSNDDGATWAMQDVSATNAENVFTVNGEDDKIYFVSDAGAVWTSTDDGQHVWENFAGVGESALGFWVDATS